MAETVFLLLQSAKSAESAVLNSEFGFKAPRAVSANASGPCLPFPALAKSAPAPVAEQPRPGRGADLPLRGHADFSAVPNVDPVRWSHGFEPAERVRAIPIRATALPPAGLNANACAS